MRRERFAVRVAVHIILLRFNNVLLSRRYNTGWEDGKYCLVAGHLEEDETIVQAMQREAKEEASIDIAERDLHVVHTMYRKSKNNYPYIDLYFIADTWNGEVKNGEEDKCDELRWFPIANLPNNTLPHIKQVLDCFQNDISFSEITE